jgi:hypothetical protein
MNKELSILLKELRLELKDEPTSMIYADMSKGNKSILDDYGNVQLYFDFLKECDGARFGAVDLWSFSELSEHQFRIIELVGETENWLEIGQVLYEPLVIEKSTGLVYLFKQSDPETLERSFGEFDDFLLHYVFGRKYGDIVPDAEIDDEWYQFLMRQEFV